MIPAILAPYLAPIVARLVPHKIVIGGMVIVAAVVFIDRRATYRERARCDTAKLQSQLNAALADIKNEKEALADARKKSADLEAQKSQSDEAHERLKKQIASLPVGEQCIITRDRAKRM